MDAYVFSLEALLGVLEPTQRTTAFDPKQTLAGSNLTRRLSVNWRVPGPHRAPGELVLHR